MCGRYVLEAKLFKIAEEFGIDVIATRIEASYNIAPTQTIPIVVNDGEKRIDLCKWGLIPAWSKDTSYASKLINARAEKLSEKPSFRNAYRQRRCLIPANGYFEWQKRESKKVPVYLHMKSKNMFGMAGLWEEWKSPEGEVIKSCTIITTNSTGWITKIHHRMPVILLKELRDQWLDPEMTDTKVLQPMLQPYDHDLMSAYEVSTNVNSPRNNSPDLLDDVSESNLFPFNSSQ